MVVACAAVMFFGKTVCGMPVEYDQNIYLFHEGANDPTTESTIWTLDSGSNPGVVSSGAGTETIGSNTYDYWFTEDSGSAASNFLRYSDTITSAQALNPWTLRTRVRSAATTDIDQIFTLYDGTNRWGVWIRDGDLLSANSSFTSLATTDLTSDYRDIELLYTPVSPGITNSSDLLELYIDQLFVTSFTRADTFATSTAPSIVFGGSSSGGEGRANWNRIEFVEGATVGFAQVVLPPVPEPSTLGLLALGGVFFLRRQSKAGRRG